jgi:tRNA uridine 5-carboxymethylaminomethyl modification enzyme
MNTVWCIWSETVKETERKPTRFWIKLWQYIRRWKRRKDREYNNTRRMEYGTIHGLSSEIREKLGCIKPTTLGQASRISGVTPAAISILMVYLEKTRREKSKNLRETL